ncbi:MAG: glycosyltransferase family 4 protein [Actinomycetia bacterium]|nr:glycosyltransferase family 4 protein [Actinomycetes bacterium]
MESLRSALCSHDPVELGVAARGAIPFEPFDEEGVRYFHLQAPGAKGGLAGVIERWRRVKDDEQVLAQAAAVVEDFGPDLIHVHGSEGPIGLLAESTAVPVLVSLQGLLLVCSRFYLTGIPPTEVLRDVLSVRFLKGGGLVHGWWNMRDAAERETRILRSCRYFAGRTEWDKSVLSVVNPDARYYHVEEALRAEFYEHAWRGPSSGPFVIYTTHGANPYKGLINLLEAVALLCKAGRRDIRVRVGGGVVGTVMWPIAQRAVSRFGLETAVEWLGPLSPGSIASELEGASVYVHPSVIENSSNALAEAMMLGLPCVATSGGGTPSMIRDGVDGLLCAPNDVYGLAGKIAAIEADPMLAAELGNNARIRARQRHDPSAIARATVDMYADIVARHCEGRR